MMQAIPGGAAARPFVTHHNALDLELYLRVAPELYLKRLLVGGLHRVYEINRNFRNEGISTQHNPEFTMLEFYWAYADYHQLMDLTEEMLVGLASSVLGAEKLSYKGKTLDLKRPWPRWTMAEALHKLAGVEPARTETVEGLLAEAQARGLALPPELQAANPFYGKLLAFVFEELCEPSLDGPAFIIDHPVEISPLSKQKPEDAALHRALRALPGRHGGRQRLLRAQRPRRPGRALPRSSSRRATPATTRRTASTPTTSGRSSTACRRPAARGSASTG